MPSYLFEPAGSIHTLHVPASNDGVTDVWFTIHGANLNLSADGRIESVVDAGAIFSITGTHAHSSTGSPTRPSS